MVPEDWVSQAVEESSSSVVAVSGSRDVESKRGSDLKSACQQQVCPPRYDTDVMRPSSCRSMVITRV